MNTALINTALISCFVFILIYIDYARKLNTDDFQRKLFLSVLIASCIATITDFASRFIMGVPGVPVAYMLYGIITVFYIAQNTTYYLLIVLIDYFSRSDAKRAKKGLTIVGVFLLLYAVFAVSSITAHPFFHISEDNQYITGPYYIIRLFISYLPILIILVNSVISYKYFTGTQVYMLILFGTLNGGGAALDIVFRNSFITWPCFAAAVLYIYFFIVQNDTKIDSLTSIGNRNAFNEFIDNLSHHSARQSYAITMIDMNHFKDINDTFGHSAGDKALVEMAQIIKANIRHSDFAARYGGDEFIIAIKAQHDMERLMERIQQAIYQLNSTAKNPYKIGISYGYDFFTTHSGQDIEEFLVHIDSLMYEHKARQKSKVECAGSAGEPPPAT
jgi:diguanylate cyclase (GGDEF)-like protein